MFQLLDRRYRPKMSEIRERASRLLKHFPWSMDADDMERALIARHARAMRRVLRKIKCAEKAPF